MTVDVVRSVEGVAALKPDYERLNHTTGNTLPFALHDWHLTWCGHFLNQHPRIRDQPMFHIVRNGAGVCVAIAPLILSRRRVGVLDIVSVSLLGADPAITEIRAPLIETGYEHPAGHAIHASLAAASDWDWIHWTGINSPEFGEALELGGEFDWQPALPNYVLDLPATWEEFRAGLKRNIRESLRHCYNSLKRDGHYFELQVAQDPAEIRLGLDRFFELHAMRANLRSSVPHANHFASPIARGFLHALCERMAARGAVRLFQLKVGADIVAMRIGFVVGASLYLYYSGFDPSWSRYSVMTTTVAEAIKYAITHGLKSVDLSPGTDVSKTRWGPRVVEYRAAYEHNGRLRSRLARHAYLKARSGKGLQARLLQRLIPGRRVWR